MVRGLYEASSQTEFAAAGDIDGINDGIETEVKIREATVSGAYFVSLVGMAFPTTATREPALNVFRNSGFWPVDLYVFTTDEFGPSMATDRPETIQLKTQTAEGIEHFSLSSAHAAKTATPKQTPDCKG
jgi:hypothetical protein